MKRTISISLLIMLISLFVAAPAYSQSGEDRKGTQDYKETQHYKDFIKAINLVQLTEKRIIAVTSNIGQLPVDVESVGCPSPMDSDSVKEIVKQEFMRYRIQPIESAPWRLVLFVGVNCVGDEVFVFEMSATLSIVGLSSIDIGTSSRTFGRAGKTKVAEMIPMLKRYVEKKLALFVEAHLENPKE